MSKVSLFQNRVPVKVHPKCTQGRYSMLELDEGKLSRPVLRRGGESNLASLSRRTMYRPDLLFHQQYPTRYGSKVTRCRMPSDKTPTVTRLASEPRGNDVSASTRRRWGRMHGMVNTCELLEAS